MTGDYYYEDGVADEGYAPPRPTRTREWGAPDTLRRVWGD